MKSKSILDDEDIACQSLLSIPTASCYDAELEC